jgi:hypothetical protein
MYFRRRICLNNMAIGSHVIQLDGSFIPTLTVVSPNDHVFIVLIFSTLVYLIYNRFILPTCFS